MKKIMFTICIIVISFVVSAQIPGASYPSKPGSGNSIQLTGTGNLSTAPHINIGSGYDFHADPFTYETWVKRDLISPTLNNYGKTLLVGNDNGSWGVGFLNDNTIFFTKVNFNAVVSDGTVKDMKWHHIAIVYTGSEIRFYLDGVASGVRPYSSSFDNTSGDYIIGPRLIFGNSNGDQTLDGQIDETRIWKNVALTQAQIQEWMCKKVTSAHPAYANLFAYYRMDEGSGTTTYSIGNHSGTLVNNPSWQISGAALGDASAYDYTNTTKTTSLSATGGDKLSVTSTSGNPDGIQIYRVDEQPNNLSGTIGVGTNNKYFGVFQVGETASEYTAVYNYNVSAPDYSDLRLFKRADNSVVAWNVIGVTPDQTAKTITVSGESTEYILGSLGAPLPVSLSSFQAWKKNSSIILNWSTQNEINFSNFEVERSNNQTNFHSIGEVESHQNTSLSHYSLEDKNPLNGINFYRLKMVDRDKKVMFSNVVSVNFKERSTLTIYPNPAKEYIYVEGVKEGMSLEIIDPAGKVVKKFVANTSNRYLVQDLNKGYYLIKIKGSDNTAVSKLIIE